MTSNFKNKTILITGGTGSFGQALINYLLKIKNQPKKIIVFSRDELKQFHMSKFFDQKKFSNIRFFLGDIRDKDRLKLAFEEVDIVVHAAALKQVPAAEYNPFEFIKTNVIGSQNIVEACLDSNVKNVISLSTDKASSPINLYGATKLCADKLFIGANNIKGKKDIKFSVVRYGNVMGSRGSVLHNFIEQKKNGFLSVTDTQMTRFNINMHEAIQFVINALAKSKGGEIFVPKIPSFYITDLAKAVGPNCKIKIVGIREGEKIHEEMISKNESYRTVDLGNYYAILNSHIFKYYKNNKFLKSNFAYRSNTNKDFLTVEQLKKIINNFQHMKS
jgi:UDP-N-acetylglucosamine 4,6-dehydratase (inverting)